MRAREFIVEYKEYPTREYEGVTFTMKEKDGQLIVKPLNDYGISMGHVVFNMDGKILDPQDLVIADKYQGQGIARVMYDYIKSLGFTIERSWDQTEAGKGFWDKHRGEDVRIWEEVNPDIYHNEFKHDVEIGDYRYTAETDNNSGYGNQLIIKVYDGNNEIANAEFIEEPHDKALISANTWVQEEYEGQGIATNMYAYAKMLGNDIIPSWNQTDAGERMWRSWNQSGQSKHILPKGHKGFRELDEQINEVKVYHGNQGGIHRELIAPMWWTESKEDAINYATQGGADGWVYSATLSCKNPYVIKPTDETNTVLEKWKQLEKQGYDSIYDESVGDWIPFYSKDIHLVSKPEYQEER